VYVFTTKLLAICEQLFKLVCINVLYGILLNEVFVYHEWKCRWKCLPCVTDKTKSPTSEARWESLGLINGGAAHPIRLAFWGEGNCPVTSGIRANLYPTPMSRQAPQRVG